MTKRSLSGGDSVWTQVLDDRSCALPLWSQLPLLEMVAQLEIVSMSKDAAASEGRRSRNCEPYSRHQLHSCSSTLVFWLRPVGTHRWEFRVTTGRPHWREPLAVHLTTRPPPHRQHQDPHQQSSQSFQLWSPTEAQSHHYRKTANSQLNKVGFLQDVLRPGSLPNKSIAGIFPISKVSSPPCKIPKLAVLPTGCHLTAFLAQVS